MARVTVEDCLEHVENRFELVLLATKRARQLNKGSEPFLERGKDKDTVLALREIAEGYITPEVLEQIQSRTHAAASAIEAASPSYE